MKRLFLLPFLCLVCNTSWAQDSGDDYLKQYGVYDIVEQYGNDSYDDTPTYPTGKTTSPTSGDDYLKEYGVYDTVQQYAPSNNTGQKKTTNNAKPVTGDDYLKQYGVYDTVQQYAPSNNTGQKKTTNNAKTTYPSNNTKTTYPSNNKTTTNNAKTQPANNNYQKPYNNTTQQYAPSNNTGQTNRQPSQKTNTNSVYTGYDDIDAILKDSGIDSILSDPSYNDTGYDVPDIQVYQPEPVTPPPTVITQPTPTVTQPRPTVTTPTTTTVPQPRPTVTTPTTTTVTQPRPTVTTPTTTTVTQPRPTVTTTPTKVTNSNTPGIPSALASTSVSYYAHLNATEKRIYDAVYEAARRRQADVQINGKVSDDALDLAIQSVSLDHPEIIWMVAAYSFGEDLSGNTNVTLEFVPLNTTHYQAFVAEADKILAEARKLSTPLEKEKYVYDWIVTHTTYGSSTYDQTAYGALMEHQAVCAGFSALFHYLMNRLGVPTYIATGYSSSEDGTGEHAWNIILLNGRYYNVDPTLRPFKETDQYGNVVLTPAYSLFNKSDSFYKKEGYTRDSERGKLIQLPTCPD